MALECEVCQRPTREFWVAFQKEKRALGLKCEVFEEIPLCRTHLVERFRAEFCRSSQRLVVFYPNLENWHGNYQYVFASAATLAKDFCRDRKTRKMLHQRLETWLGMIKGGCTKCPGPGEVAFFPQEAVAGIHGAARPFNLHEVDWQPQILCRACAFTGIAHSLQYPGPGFEEGAYAPLPEDGVYLTVAS